MFIDQNKVDLKDVFKNLNDMADDNSIEEYRKRRDFSKTGEPDGGPVNSAKTLVFVIQKHKATRLHYDFRLEVGGVLKSWAVPKMPPTSPNIRRLAIPTEDHPLAYSDFEGVIPRPEYGAGTVLVWDKGTYKNIKEKDGVEVPLEECIQNGEILVFLEGRKLQGGYALIRLKKSKDNAWLMVKMKDDQANVKDEEELDSRSVLTGRTLEEIERNG